MYGPGVDTRAWADGRIPDALLSEEVWSRDRPLVLPGVDEVLVVPTKGFDGPEVLPGMDDWTPAAGKGFDQPEVLPGLDERALFKFERVALFDPWSGQMLTVDEQGLVVDHYRGGGWASNGWDF